MEARDSDQARTRDGKTALALWLALAAAVAIAYAPSLGGGWVWDDFYQIAHSGALDHPLGLWLHDVWWLAENAPDSDIYRPLAVASHTPGRWLGLGPGFERLVSLGLHLLCVALVAAIARAAGARPDAAWAGAALFALHPGASEAVAWISARHDLLATAVFLCGWWGLAAGRTAVAAVGLGLAVFAKEPFLLAPLAACIWMWGGGRWRPAPVILASVAIAAYLGIRLAIGLTLSSSSAFGPDLVGVAGGVALRGLALALVPGSADALPVLTPAPAVGWVLVGLVPLVLAVTRGRPALAASLTPLPLLAPAIPASAALGLCGDRYFYVGFASLGIACALAATAWLERQPPPGRRISGHRALAGAALVVALVLGSATFLRAGDWRDNESVFGASLARDPNNPYAAFHLAHELHARQNDCEAALPLYEAALAVEQRARNNRQACLLDLGRIREAAELGPALVAEDPTNPGPAANTARALAQLGAFASAERFALEALRRDETRARNWVLLGNLQGLQGRHGEAAEAFRRAIALRPDD
ncbi:MAG: hypothetical protein MJE66_22515, partial [Proteobacteria bacterium]|nr:hypothetical protein [Pseudomonadota bacterium]